MRKRECDLQRVNGVGMKDMGDVNEVLGCTWMFYVNWSCFTLFDLRQPTSIHLALYFQLFRSM